MIEGTKVQGVLVNDTPFRIGGGKTSVSKNAFQQTTDSAMMTRKGVPFIPGSTLKGFMRGLVESIVKTKGGEVVYPYEEDEKDEKKGKPNDIVSQLFGSKSNASAVEVMDAMPLETPTVHTRTMVSIDRVFNGQYPSNLYSLDLVDKGNKFKFTALLWGVKLNEECKGNDERGEVISQVIETMKSGFQIGGRKSTGLGLMRLTEVKCTQFGLSDVEV
ncbi:type III CRISPR-associated RAMP protein Csx7 [Sulfuracidifex tepidarius]|uniref:CRISPR type III-associated protein domain-containing protein n=1 Tax=Sulfuracidifex tepidarius TaxID=1294262 RepID=A0A510E0F3_9CREN|nr:CRISPR-associated RAMP protein Csx7 [Sulfuracidifex tepidarius]BBG23168.1 hypothetical protein IC006_0452 [Sulfuracidifex tepidarius]BBG25917.1 hypothetical protein IC007_0422 [Sulfuracidifex tepidarius]